MEIILKNSPQILTDFNEHVRIDNISYVFIEKNCVEAIVGGTQVSLTGTLSQSEAQESLDIVLDAINKYDPTITLCIKRDYVDDKKIFEGTHTLISPSDSDPDYLIKKYTYSGSKVILEQGPLVGAWGDRENLGW